MTACTIAEKPKPRISAYRISQVIAPAMPNASPRWPSTLTTTSFVDVFYPSCSSV